MTLALKKNGNGGFYGGLGKIFVCFIGVLDNYVDSDYVYVEWLEISRRVYFFSILYYYMFYTYR